MSLAEEPAPLLRRRISCLDAGIEFGGAASLFAAAKTGALGATEGLLIINPRRGQFRHHQTGYTPGRTERLQQGSRITLYEFYSEAADCARCSSIGRMAARSWPAAAQQDNISSTPVLPAELRAHSKAARLPVPQ